MKTSVCYMFLSKAINKDAILVGFDNFKTSKSAYDFAKTMLFGTIDFIHIYGKNGFEGGVDISGGWNNFVDKSFVKSS